MKKYAGVLLISKDERIILQERDSNTAIINPGKITFFGGTVHDDESQVEAAVRELQEELDLFLQAETLEMLGVYYKQKLTDGEDVECHIFVSRNIDIHRLHLREGKAIYYFIPEDLHNPKLSRITQLALTDYLN